jgi:hypothetical protein
MHDPRQLPTTTRRLSANYPPVRLRTFRHPRPPGFGHRLGTAVLILAALATLAGILSAGIRFLQLINH